MGQVGGQFPLVGEELDDLVGHGVERDGGAPQFVRSLLGHPRAEPALPQFVRPVDQAPRGLHHPDAQPVGDRDRADDQGGADRGEHRPGRADAVGHRGLGDEHLDDGDLAGAERDRLQQAEAAVHLGGRGPAHLPYGGDVVVGGALPAEVGGVPAAAPGRRYVHGHPGVRSGRGDDAFQLLAVGGDGQGRCDGGGLPLGAGEGAVAGHLADDESEGHGEGDHDHRGDRERDLDQRPSHRGGSSFTPTPRRVCR